MKKEVTTNIFTKGLMMDLHPMMTPNDVLTNALNATLITYSGNEYALLNDMGNGRVETAELPAGYVPLGIAELGGIIYVVSYNPQEALCLIGSFPSPERNITSNELGNSNIGLNLENFYLKDLDLAKTTIRVLLTNVELNPGDKFKIFSKGLSDLGTAKISGLENNTPYSINRSPKLIKFHVASILDDGKIVYLDDSLVWGEKLGEFPFYIKDGSVNIDKIPEEYAKEQDEIKANYCVFSSKTSGKLAIIAELEVIDTFDCSLELKKENKTLEITPSLNWTYENELKDYKDDVNPSYIKYTLDGDNYTSIKLSNIPTDRKNDGTDDPFIISDNKDKININLDKDIINLDIIPGMEFGYMPWLKHSFSINTAKLGTGETSLNEYRYFVENEVIALNWGLDSYPEEGCKVNNVSFSFYELTKENLTLVQGAKTINGGKDSGEDKDCDNKLPGLSNPKFTFNDIKRSSYLGHFQKTLSIGENQNLDIDKCYIVEINIKYQGKEEEKDRYIYRILYTCKVFNDDYYKVNDFAELTLTDERLKVTYDYKYTPNDNHKHNPQKLYEGNNLIESLPLNSDVKDEEKNFKVKDVFNNNIDVDIEFKSIYDKVFTIIPSSNELSITGGDIARTKDATKYYLTGDSNNVPEIEIDSESKTINTDFTSSVKDSIITLKNINFVTTVNTPIKAIYNGIIDKNVEYSLSPLNLLLRYIASETNKKEVIPYYFSKWTDDRPSNISFSFAGDDNDGFYKSIPLQDLPKISDAILLDLNSTNCDGFVIIVTNGSGRKDRSSCISYNWSNPESRSTLDKNSGAYRKQGPSGIDWSRSDTNRDYYPIFVFKGNGTIYGFHISTERKTKDVSDFGKGSVGQMVQGFNNICDLLSKYYRKATKYVNGGNLETYVIKNEYYSWNDYSIDNTINFTLNLNKSIKILDLDLTDSIKNLSYETPKSKHDITINIYNDIEMLNYHNLVKKGFSEKFVELDGELISLEVSPKLLYKIKDSSNILASTNKNFNFFGSKTLVFDLTNSLTIIKNTTPKLYESNGGSLISVGLHAEGYFAGGDDSEEAYISNIINLIDTEWNPKIRF